MNKRKPWVVRVNGLERVPRSVATRMLEEVQKTMQEWLEKGPDPLVIPGNMEILNCTDEWEHKVIGLHYLHPSDLVRLIKDYEKDGWQVATSIERSGCSPVLIFKRPKPLEAEESEPELPPCKECGELPTPSDVHDNLVYCAKCDTHWINAKRWAKENTKCPKCELYPSLDGTYTGGCQCKDECLCGHTPEHSYEHHVNPKCPYYAT